MSKSINLEKLLCNFAVKQDSVFVHFLDFFNYTKRYSAKHITENPELSEFQDISQTDLFNKIENLSDARKVCILNKGTEKVIAVLGYYSICLSSRYRDILANKTPPFPSLADLPKQILPDFFEMRVAVDIIPIFFFSQDTELSNVYRLKLPRELPMILFPESLPITTLIACAMAKICYMLKKSEYYDYFLKKLKIANSGKESSVTTFFEKIVKNDIGIENIFQDNVDYFYLWNQLSYFIRQDFEKIEDKSTEDINVLQAIALVEIWVMFQKEAQTAAQKKEEALKELEVCLGKPPYFFEMDTILKFRDSFGKQLYGQFSQDDLQNFLNNLTTNTRENTLPKLIILKIESGKRYFIYKTNIVPLIIRLSNEAHNVVEKHLIEKWFRTLQCFEVLPEMKDNKSFEKELLNCIRDFSPVLYSLLTSDFLPLLNAETREKQNKSFNIFFGAKLKPYSELLMLKNTTILAKAKMQLPVWYFIPIVSWIGKLFIGKKLKAEKNAQTSVEVENNNNSDSNIKNRAKKIGAKREILATSAKEIALQLVPSGSSIDRELESYLDNWNRLLSKEAREQLTSDVNAVICDYMRNMIKTISPQTFNLDRVQSLARTLVRTQNMQKIGQTDALTMYVELYILRLISNG